jgi:S-phase kinase-associated protein 1
MGATNIIAVFASLWPFFHSLPHHPSLLQVTETAWALVHEWCRFHAVAGRSDAERRRFDDRFARHATSPQLCELTGAANSLEITPLVEVGSRGIAKLIQGRSPEQIREIFGLADDLTEEEKLAAVPDAAGDPRVRMLNRVNEKRLRALRERRAIESGGGEAAAASALPPARRDERPIDELLNFIEEEPAAGKGGGKKRAAKKAAVAAAKPRAAPAAAGGAAPPPTSAGAPLPPRAAPRAAPRLPGLPPPALLPLDPSSGSGSDSDGDPLGEPLVLDPLRAFFAGLAAQQPRAQLTSLTSLAAFKAARRQVAAEEED